MHAGGAAEGPLARVAGPAEAPLAFIKRAPAEATRREAEALRAIDHPGVVRLLDEGHEGEAGCLRLGYVEGQDLVAVIAARGGRLQPDGVLRLLSALADATGAIHAAGFLHRDLKPANVRVRPDQTPVIVDLGAAAPIGAAVEAGQPAWLTHGYAAPEQYLGEGPEGPWTDVYALGAIGYRALTGGPPPPAPARLLGKPLPPLQVADLSPALAGAIEAALALEPGARPKSARLFRSILLQGVDDGAEDAFPPTVEVERLARRMLTLGPPAVDDEPRRRGRGGAWLLGLLLIAALGASTVAGVRYGRPLYERFVKQDWLVDPAGGGDAITIGDALRRSGEEASIRIAAGTYVESLQLDHAVHLQAADPEAPPLIAPESGPCAVLGEPGSSLRGLELRNAADDPLVPCLHVGAEALIEGNTITSRSGPAILVDAGARPRIQNNVVEDSRIGLLITGGAGGEITANTIRGDEGPALVVRGGARPTLLDNALEGAGVVFSEGAGGLLEGNRVIGAEGTAVAVTSGADPVVRYNRLEDAGEAAIFVYDQGRGVFEGNTIAGAGVSGVVVADGGQPKLFGNTIEGSGEHGVLVVEGGNAVVKGNAITTSAGHGIAVGPGAEVELDANQFRDNGKEPAVMDGRKGLDEGS